MVRARAQLHPSFATLICHDVPSSTGDGKGAYIVRADVVVRIESVLQGALPVDVGMVHHQQRPDEDEAYGVAGQPR